MHFNVSVRDIYSVHRLFFMGTREEYANLLRTGLTIISDVEKYLTYERIEEIYHKDILSDTYTLCYFGKKRSNGPNLFEQT